MKKYTAPEVEIVRLQVEEALMLSAGDGGQEGPPQIDNP